MCWFITIGVSQAHQSELRDATGRCTQLSFAPNSGTPTAAAFPGDDCCVQVTHKWCSCDLYINPEWLQVETFDWARERKRLIKKGWSTAKIERCLRDKSASAERPKARPEPRAAVAFREFVDNLVEMVGEVRLLAHFYSGNQDTEVLDHCPWLDSGLASLPPTGFPADTIFTLSRNANGATRKGD